MKILPEFFLNRISQSGSFGQLSTEFDLVLEVGEADLLDVLDAFGAEGCVILLPVDLGAGVAREGLEVGRGGIRRLDFDDERRKRLHKRPEGDVEAPCAGLDVREDAETLPEDREESEREPVEEPLRRDDD